MSTAISGRIALLRFSTSTPDMSERERSTSATSKGFARTWAIASSPVRASPATSMSTRPEKTCLRPIRTTSWSSTISSRIIALVPTVWLEEPITSRPMGRGGVGNLGFACRTNPTPGELEGVAEDDPVAFDGNVFTLESREIRHQLACRFVDDVAVGGVVAEAGLPVARRGTAPSRFGMRHEIEVDRVPGVEDERSLSPRHDAFEHRFARRKLERLGRVRAGHEAGDC